MVTGIVTATFQSIHPLERETMFRRMTMIVFAVLTALGSMLLLSPVAHAAPLGTTAVVPTMAACQQGTPASNVTCAAAFTNRFLAAHGAVGVVRQTVLVKSGAFSVWPTPVGGLCVFSDAEFLQMGAHHCDRTTFISLGQSFDRQLMSNRVHAIAVLAHESAHGVEQRAGVDLVTPALTGDNAAVLPTEQAGDCWAAVAIRWYIQQDMLPASSHDEARQLFYSIGSSRDLSHGTGPMRAAAFDAGYSGGSAACNKLLGRTAFPV